MENIPVSVKHIFDDLQTQKDVERFDLLQKSRYVTIERIVSKGHTSPRRGWYDQNRDEWVLLLQGEASLLLQNQDKIDLKAGDYLLIKAHTKHKVSWTHPEMETVWLAIHFN